jgi:hypothetical protein
MVKHGKIMCVIVHHVIFPCGWPNLPILNHGSYWPTMFVVWAILGITIMLICDQCF